MTDKKPWYKSKTVWINVITLCVGITAVLSESETLPQEAVLILTALVVPILNVFLRWLTNKPITSIAPVFDRLRDGSGKPN